MPVVPQRPGWESVYRAGRHRRAGGYAGLFGSFPRHLADHLGGPEEAGQGQSGRQLFGPVPDPTELLHVVEGVALAGRVVVEDVLSREPPRDKRVRHKELARLLPDLGLVAPQPQELRSHGLGRAHRAAASEQGLAAVEVVELPDLLLGPRVDTVQDRRPQGLPGLVSRQQAGPDAARADRRHAFVGPVEQLPADGDEVVPPHSLRVVLGPAWPGKGELVLPLGGRDDLAVGSGQNTLGARGPDVHAEQQPAHLAPP